MKQAHPDLEQARRIVELGLDLYAGDDNLIYPFLEVGAIGGICVHTHVVGPQVKEMVRAFHSGDRARAGEIHEQLEASYELLKVVGNPIAIKQALHLTGHDVGGLRLPMVEATEDETERIRSCLERLGVLVAA